MAITQERLNTSLHCFKQVLALLLGTLLGVMKLQGILVILGSAGAMVLLTQLFVSVVLRVPEETYEWKDIQGEAGMLAFMCFMLSWIMSFTFL